MHSNIRLHKLADCIVFFDFDNTIATFDVFDDIIKRFSISKNWVNLEKQWVEGKIGSLECLREQLKGVRVKKETLLRYLSKVLLAPNFHKVATLLKREGVKTAILSDNFSFIIREILRKNGLGDIQVFANRVRFLGDRLIPSFPYTNKRCPLCAHCKKKNLLKNHLRDKIIFYIGDGRTDICPAEEADIVFAKGELLKYFRRKKLLCVEFDDFEDIYNYLKALD